MLIKWIQCVALGAMVLALWSHAETPPQGRNVAKESFEAGNFRDAYRDYRHLVLAADTDPQQVGEDLRLAAECLRQLGRTQELDELLEGAIARHPHNWRLLWSAAMRYQEADHFGSLVAGKFTRGNRGGGNAVNSLARDRVRALQLMNEAQRVGTADGGRLEAPFYRDWAAMWQASGEPWRLAGNTNLDGLPDYGQGWYFGGGQIGAPVDEQGNPIYYPLPAELAAASNDGERWRWCLEQVALAAPAERNQVLWTLAQFYHQQFGVQTIAEYRTFFSRDPQSSDSKEGIWSLDRLTDTETIARLASGIKRFSIPDDYNPLKLLGQIAAEPKAPWAQQAVEMLASIHEDRRQYPRAADYWRQAAAQFGNTPERQARLQQIVGNWGRFEQLVDQPAGKNAELTFRFRNAKRVQFVAQQIDVGRLLDDVKKYLQGHTGQIDWQKIDVSNIGFRLIQSNPTPYLLANKSEWSRDLEPREGHFDSLTTIETPISAGVWWISAKMDDGNTSYIVLWVADTAIVKKQLAGKSYYFVADAATGAPVSGAQLDFFGFQQEQLRGNRFRVVTRVHQAATDAEGQATIDLAEGAERFQWLVTARAPGRGTAGRLAYLGFHGIWRSDVNDHALNQTRAIVITDRPVYRPGQTVHFKVWVAQARYDAAEITSFAGQQIPLEIRNARGDKILEKTFTADGYGGFDGTLELPGDASLGVYSVMLPKFGNSSFRVEEYKKPEYEVTVEAPNKPVTLGDKITAQIKARYYFGAPVTQARVHYKVLRTTQHNTWYPIGPWDWLYGRGYSWLGNDADWYPGWNEWGCARPAMSWWPVRRDPPEVVLESEAEIGPDGTLQIEIDTSLAKLVHGGEDHRYEIHAEVVDQSRRTITGRGEVIAARKPFEVRVWLDRGFYRPSDTIGMQLAAVSPAGQPVTGKAQLRLLRIELDADRKPRETELQKWDLPLDEAGRLQHEFRSPGAGQFRLAATVTDAEGHAVEGGYLFRVLDTTAKASDFGSLPLELVLDRPTYQPGDKARLLINSQQANSTVLLFVRPTNGVYQPPKVIRLSGHSAVEEIEITARDFPNFFVEAISVSGARLRQEVREVLVPPEKRVLNVEVMPSSQDYRPGQQAKVQLKVTDAQGQPVVGSVALSVYDKALEYISGGSNVPDVREFFWKWRRGHHPNTETSLSHWSGNLVKPNQTAMQDIGIFGAELTSYSPGPAGMAMRNEVPLGAVAAPRFKMMAESVDAAALAGAPPAPAAEGAGGGEMVSPTLRTQFADTAYWAAALSTNEQGLAEVEFAMPQNLTAWKFKAWALGAGTRVGQGEAEAVTSKKLLVRMQAPRFFVERDEVVLSANVHNYLSTGKPVQVMLAVDEAYLSCSTPLVQTVQIDSQGEARVDWRVTVRQPGEAVIRMSAITDEESDAVEMRLPIYVHGMLRTESFAGAIRADRDRGGFDLHVPEKRRPHESRFELRYTPSVAAAMVDALPYLVDYPYGCTEQTLNRFLPAAITASVLREMKIDLDAVRQQRAQQPAAPGRPNPLFDPLEVQKIVAAGVAALAEMQLADGGWGWFSGYGERSDAHTTAWVLHGLQIAKANQVAVDDALLERGRAWLATYQQEQLRRLQNADSKTDPYKPAAENLDALVYQVLVAAGTNDTAMLDFLYRDRVKLSVYGKTLLGLALAQQERPDMLAMVRKNIEQFLVTDEENQTAYLQLPEDNYWWFWYGSRIEAQSMYLKLLARIEPKGETTARVARYLINNRQHASYWNSTRDTGLAIEALADYLRASGEAESDLFVEVWIDGAKRDEAHLTPQTLFTSDHRFLLSGDELTTGDHQVELRKRGTGPLYYSASLANFSLEDQLTAAGLDLKVRRAFYRLVPEEQAETVAGDRGQSVAQKVEKYRREPIGPETKLESGDLVEVELEIETKNDYEYLIFEDMKAAGFEPVEVRSGYGGNSLGAYLEMRDNRVVLLVRQLNRGRHSVAYRTRAEIPGSFSALPALGAGMYAPELKANSDEMHLKVAD